MSNNDWNQNSLTPVLLTETDASFRTVQDIQNAIRKDDILNIAVTGPYGSSKSSVLRTFIAKADRETKILDISLATLDADESFTSNEVPDTQLSNHDKERLLNRKIEYSILQQLVYRKTLEALPYSRMRKIRHLDAYRIRRIAAYVLGYIFFIALATKSSLIHLPLIYRVIGIPMSMQNAICILSILLLFIMTYEILKYILKYYGGLRPEKFSVAGNEVNIRDERSIFNRYLDEILYFFQCTDYNVVIIEDLDRFKTTEIFLKLRELNHIINKSEMVGRTVRFIYAVKDDMFKDASRSKFFDYITTVIPVITSSNAKDKLKQALKEIGHEGVISDEDIRDIAFHIDDMRLLYNIANEYYQYSKRLSHAEHPLEARKMLAMMTLKNYHPHDFSELHNRRGNLYKALSPEAKRGYIKYAITKRIAEREDIAKRNLAAYDASCHLSLKELRMLYLLPIADKASNPQISFMIDGKGYSLRQVAETSKLFDYVTKVNTVTYAYKRPNFGDYQHDTINYNFSKIEKEVNPNFTYQQRASMIGTERVQLERELAEIEMEKKRVSAYSIQQLIEKFNIYEEDFFKKIGLSDLEENFIRRGLLAEDYNDYISYFYPEIMSLADHQLCLDIKLNRKTEFDAPIDNVELLLKELPTTAFQYKSIWNYHILDFLAEHDAAWRDEYLLYIDTLISKDSSHFLYLYAKNGKMASRVYTDCMEGHSEEMWEKIQTCPERERHALFVLWFTTCSLSDIHEPQTMWINHHYDFIASIYSLLSEDKQEYLTTKVIYESLKPLEEEILKKVVANGCYLVNENNMPVIVESKQAKDDISKLGDKEEKQMALQMDLLSATWYNVNEYFLFCDKTVDDVLAHYIETHINHLLQDPNYSNENHAILFQSLLEFNGFTESVYQKISIANRSHITLTEAILEQSEKNLMILIESETFEYDLDTLKALNQKSVRLACLYMYQYKSKLSEMLLAVMVSEELAIELLDYGGFNQVDYQKVIAVLNPSRISMNETLANKICALLSVRYSICDEIILYDAIQLCTNIPHAVITATRKIQDSGLNHKIICSLLEILPEEYHELTELHKQPKFEDHGYNKFLIETLKQADYISSFTTEKGMIKVYTKRK